MFEIWLKPSLLQYVIKVMPLHLTVKKPALMCSHTGPGQILGSKGVSYRVTENL